LPSFISECGFGGIRKSAPMRRTAGSPESREAFVMTETDDGFLQAKDRLTDRPYAAIGRVAALWAEAEGGLERILERLALVPSLLGYVLTDRLGPDPRIGAIYALINVHRVKYHSRIVAEDLLAEIEDYLPSVSAVKYVESPQIRQSRRIVLREIYPRKDEKEWWNDERLEAAASDVCACYDILGLIIERDWLGGYKVFKRYWARSIVDSHDALEQFLHHRRQRNSRAYAAFTRLADTARPYAGIVRGVPFQPT
jgi:hypothetical protein